MNQADRDAEWQNILAMAKDCPHLAYILREREERFRVGLSTEQHTKLARKEFRRWQLGEIDAEGRRVNK